MRTGTVFAVVLALMAAAEVSEGDVLHYYVIPLSGEIGRAVTRDVVEKALREARLRKPDVVVLEINSPGGHVLELEAILWLLAENRDLRLVAYYGRHEIVCR